MYSGSARKAYADFRRTVTSVYRSKGWRTALGCTGNVPTDLQQFVTVGTASYTTAKSQPYPADLAPVGYPVATLTANLIALTQLNVLRELQATAIGNAVTATSRRNDAHWVLMDWVRQLRGIASVAFRNQPGQAQRLDS
jgi:hypothetical protein